uniref:Uncharacterized protein n=1 Tax=Arion vulgaris TaxID=1028688 RepID=A0A0B6YC46_9EUPU
MCSVMKTEVVFQHAPRENDSHIKYQLRLLKIDSGVNELLLKASRPTASGGL